MKLTVDGDFGPATKRAVIAYRRSHSLVADGVGGDKTGARMSAMENATSNASDMIGRLTLTYNRTRQAVGAARNLVGYLAPFGEAAAIQHVLSRCRPSTRRWRTPTSCCQPCSEADRFASRLT